MKRFHIAISSNNIEKSVDEYTKRLGEEPVAVVSGEYALWRTDTLNVSVRKDEKNPPGSMRHLGWEDSDAVEFSIDTDCNGIDWERFSVQEQNREILELWPDTVIRER